MSQLSTATIYLDSSALVKRYMVEAGTRWVQSLCDDPNQTIAIAEVGLVEVAAAFAGKLRGGLITPPTYRNVRADLVADVQKEYVLVAVVRSVVDEAMDLTSRHRLRGYDAIHLACTLPLNRALVANAFPPLIFVSADDDLLIAAAAEGLLTDNPTAHP